VEARRNRTGARTRDRTVECRTKENNLTIRDTYLVPIPKTINIIKSWLYQNIINKIIFRRVSFTNIS